ncbi:cytochrome P450 CYP12A2-like [Teleopsis dalmanni]|uniref:cytochrome P450 CYP12A2-like n=1 Tax=Teleopsis dalmanni TaxID=139649 RepID=UPI0018CF6187|nr:cytochrome P450 CYP12A2-like [Teleopsis dalmanni]
MFISKIANVNKQLQIINIKRFLSQSQLREAMIKETTSTEWLKAKPYHTIPGPSKLKLLKEFLPGGNLFNKPINDITTQLRKVYGDIFIFPGTFGKNDVLYTFNPKDFRTVFHTEGHYPIRRGFDIIHYHRKIHRPEVFKHAVGLVAEQGKDWAHFRSAVNPVMMNPKTTKLYASKMSKVSDEFVRRIRNIRDLSTNEVPTNFEIEINNWAMESVCLVALDKELGMINNSEANPKARELINRMQKFFELLFELDIKPSLWKYVHTPKFRQAMKIMDEMIDLTTYYIEEAIIELQEQQKTISNKGNVKSEHEKSILERLINIDRTVAIVMALDMLQAGVDTTTSALAGCLLCLSKNAEKQGKLRLEMKQILPERHSTITGEKLKHLPYLRACIKEALRLYPVATSNFRSTGQNVILSGYQVPQDTDIVMPGQLITQDEKYYDRPKDYLPERWLRSERGKTDGSGCPLNVNEPFVFLPFGFGPRVCIGKRIVDLELEVILAKLVRNFYISFDYDVENVFKTHVINVPNKPLQFKFVDTEN